jgi:hypothetical protein
MSLPTVDLPEPSGPMNIMVLSRVAGERGIGLEAGGAEAGVVDISAAMGQPEDFGNEIFYWVGWEIQRFEKVGA